MEQNGRLTRRRLLTYASLLTGGSLLAACQIGQGPAAVSPGAATAAPGRRVGGKVIVAARAVGTLESSLNLGTPTPRYMYEIYDRLVQQDLTAELETEAPPLIPGLAESWEISPDASVYTYKLRQGVEFHDGTPFDAEAVKFNVERLTKPDHPFFYQRGSGPTSVGWGRIAQIEAPDRHTVRFRLKEPYAQLNDLLWRAEYSIASPENIKKLGNEAVGQSPVGTGAFKFVSHEQGSRLELARNEDYWGGAPVIDGIIVRTITEPAAAVSALLAGELHLVADMVAPDIAKSLQASGDAQIRVRHAPGNTTVQLNMRDGPTADRRVRQALNWAVDRETYVRDILSGFGLPAKALYAPSASAYNADLKGYSYDPDKAKALLREAGLEGGFPITFIVHPSLADLGTYLKDQLAQIKVDLTVEMVEGSTLFSQADQEGTKPGVAGFVLGWNTQPPNNFDRYFPTPTAPPKGVNYGFYSNPEVDRLVQEAGRTVDVAERIKIYQRGEEIVLMEDAAWLPIHHGPTDPMAGAKDLFWVAANEYNYTLRNAYFTE